MNTEFKSLQHLITFDLISNPLFRLIYTLGKVLKEQMLIISRCKYDILILAR